MSLDRLRNALQSTPLAARLPAEDVERLWSVGVVRSFEPGTVLWTAGSPSRGLFLVLEGKVRVVGSRNGRQHLVHTSGPGALLGEVPLFDGCGYPATAVAATPVRCLIFVPTAVERLIETSPAFSRALLEGLSSRVRSLVSRLSGRTLGSVRSRVAASLLGQATGEGGTMAHVLASQHEWAEDLGTVREVLARELRALKAQGLIEQVGRGRYRIVRSADLEALAGEAYGTSDSADPHGTSGPADRRARRPG